MFVRKKSNKTGAVSVHVISKIRGQSKLVKSFGVGRAEKDINHLKEKARQFIRERTGLTHELFENEDEVTIENFVSTFSNHQLQVIGPEIISCKLYDKIGSGAIKAVTNLPYL